MLMVQYAATGTGLAVIHWLMKLVPLRSTAIMYVAMKMSVPVPKIPNCSFWIGVICSPSSPESSSCSAMGCIGVPCILKMTVVL